MNHDRWMTTGNAGNLYTPSERPGGNPAKRSFPTVLAAGAFTALLVLLASAYLAAYAVAGKNEQQRRARASEVEDAEARVDALCALVDARVESVPEAGALQISQPDDAPQRTDYVIASAAAASEYSGRLKGQAWLTAGKEGVARWFASLSTRVARPAAAEASALSEH